jgi:fumarate reductase subunit D
MAYTVKVEYADVRKMRLRNKRWYRVAHWPIWIWVFFLAPGPLTFELFARGGSVNNMIWLETVIVLTGIAAFYGQLPGSEPAPYILRFTEDRPNPLYRRVCYTFAWNALLNFALLNLAGLAIAAVTGRWYMKQIYARGYTPLCIAILALGAFGILPRVRRSTQGEGWERRYFYGTVWAVTAAQVVLLVLWKTLPRNHAADVVKIAVYCAVLIGMGIAAAFGRLPRTRPILPGELIVAD